MDSKRQESVEEQFKLKQILFNPQNTKVNTVLCRVEQLENPVWLQTEQLRQDQNEARKENLIPQNPQFLIEQPCSSPILQEENYDPQLLDYFNLQDISIKEPNQKNKYLSSEVAKDTLTLNSSELIRDQKNNHKNNSNNNNISGTNINISSNNINISKNNNTNLQVEAKSISITHSNSPKKGKNQNKQNIQNSSQNKQTNKADIGIEQNKNNQQFLQQKQQTKPDINAKRKNQQQNNFKELNNMNGLNGKKKLKMSEQAQEQQQQQQKQSIWSDSHLKKSNSPLNLIEQEMHNNKNNNFIEDNIIAISSKSNIIENNSKINQNNEQMNFKKKDELLVPINQLYKLPDNQQFQIVNKKEQFKTSSFCLVQDLSNQVGGQDQESSFNESIYQMKQENNHDVVNEQEILNNDNINILSNNNNTINKSNGKKEQQLQQHKQLQQLPNEQEKNIQSAEIQNEVHQEKEQTSQSQKVKKPNTPSQQSPNIEKTLMEKLVEVAKLLFVVSSNEEDKKSDTIPSKFLGIVQKQFHDAIKNEVASQTSEALKQLTHIESPHKNQSQKEQSKSQSLSQQREAKQFVPLPLPLPPVQQPQDDSCRVSQNASIQFLQQQPSSQQFILLNPQHQSSQQLNQQLFITGKCTQHDPNCCGKNVQANKLEKSVIIQECGWQNQQNSGQQQYSQQLKSAIQHDCGCQNQQSSGQQQYSQQLMQNRQITNVENNWQVQKAILSPINPNYTIQNQNEVILVRQIKNNALVSVNEEEEEEIEYQPKNNKVMINNNNQENMRAQRNNQLRKQNEEQSIELENNRCNQVLQKIVQIENKQISQSNQQQINNNNNNAEGARRNQITQNQQSEKQIIQEIPVNSLHQNKFPQNNPSQQKYKLQEKDQRKYGSLTRDIAEAIINHRLNHDTVSDKSTINQLTTANVSQFYYKVCWKKRKSGRIPISNYLSFNEISTLAPRLLYQYLILLGQLRVLQNHSE